MGTRQVDRTRDPMTDLKARHIQPKGDHMTAEIAALDPRKGERPAPAASLDLAIGVFRSGRHLRRIPPDPRVDTRCCDPGRRNFDRHLTGSRHRNAIAPHERLGSAMAREIDA